MTQALLSLVKATNADLDGSVDASASAGTEEAAMNALHMLVPPSVSLKALLPQHLECLVDRVLQHSEWALMVGTEGEQGELEGDTEKKKKEKEKEEKETKETKATPRRKDSQTTSGSRTPEARSRMGSLSSGTSESSIGGVVGDGHLVFAALKVLISPQASCLRSELRGIIKSIVSKLGKRGRDSFGPPKGKHVGIFCFLNFTVVTRVDIFFSSNTRKYFRKILLITRSNIIFSILGARFLG